MSSSPSGKALLELDLDGDEDVPTPMRWKLGQLAEHPVGVTTIEPLTLPQAD